MLDPRKIAEANRLARREKIVTRLIIGAVVIAVLAALLVPVALDYRKSGGIDTTDDPALYYPGGEPLPPAGVP